MYKFITIFACVSIAAVSVAAPTANEDYVDRQDAQTYSNAVHDAKQYTDQQLGNIDTGVTSVNGKTGTVMLRASDMKMSDDDERNTAETLDQVVGDLGNHLTANNPHEIDTATIGAVPTSRTVNGKALTGNVTLDADDVGAIGVGENEPGKGFVLFPSGETGEGSVMPGRRLLSISGGGGTSPGTGLPSRPISGGGERFDGLKVDGYGITYNYGDISTNAPSGYSIWNWIGYNSIFLGDVLQDIADNAGAVSSVNGETGDVTVSAAGIGAVPTSRTVNGKALTSNISIDATDVGAFGAAAGASLQSQVTTIGAHLNAEDARFVVTNYNSVTHTPEAYVEIKLPDDSWSRIWSEMTRWDWLTGTYLPGNFYTQTQIDGKLEEKADRAWGFYDSTTGAYAPDDYTWISSPKIAIAANLAYQRTVTTEGAVWVLESNGTVTETGGMTNGFFRISDDEGNSLFEIVKGNKRTVGADAASCQVVAGFSPTKLQIGYSIVSDVHPVIYVCRDLATQDWKAEDSADCVANVSWSGASGAWVAQVQGKAAYSSLFVKATYEVGGETYIRNEAPVSMSYIILNGVKYSVGTAVISGNTVLTLTVAH